jgi:hypothetical protein
MRCKVLQESVREFKSIFKSIGYPTREVGTKYMLHFFQPSEPAYVTPGRQGFAEPASKEPVIESSF